MFCVHVDQSSKYSNLDTITNYCKTEQPVRFRIWVHFLKKIVYSKICHWRSWALLMTRRDTVTIVWRTFRKWSYLQIPAMENGETGYVPFRYTCSTVWSRWWWVTKQRHKADELPQFRSATRWPSWAESPIRINLQHLWCESGVDGRSGFTLWRV